MGRACSAGVGQQTVNRQSACRPISCAVTSADRFLLAEWQPHTHGGGCEQAVVRSWQRSKKQPSNRVEYRVRGLLLNMLRQCIFATGATRPVNFSRVDRREL